MSPEERDRLIKAETNIEHLEGLLAEVRDDVKALRTLAENARGGWWTLTVVGGIGTVVGGVLVKLVPVLGKGP